VADRALVLADLDGVTRVVLDEGGREAVARQRRDEHLGTLALAHAVKRRGVPTLELGDPVPGESLDGVRSPVSAR
jgi:hypothetical protein